MTSTTSIRDRKRDHLELATSQAALGAVSAGFEDVHLIAQSLPELSLEDIDLGVTFLGHRLEAPVVISGMTGGHPAATELNAALGAAAERLGLAVGAGSQRAALRDPSLEPTYAAIRTHAPTALVIANLGACQLVDQQGESALAPAEIERAVAMLDADALAIHLNVLEEIIQPEGDERFAGIAPAIAAAVRAAPVPTIAKETGAGLARETATELARCGVAGLDVGGAGGTRFARIEAARADAAGDERRARLGRTFADWGIPTTASVLEARAVGLPIIATGGIRTGLDAAKALALGADVVGVGRLALGAARHGPAPVLTELEGFLEELKVAMLLCGARTVGDLRTPRPVLSGFTAAWASQRSTVAG